eukprot:5950929-Ditylum_brightwellii.AAC.1
MGQLASGTSEGTEQQRLDKHIIMRGNYSSQKELAWVHQFSLLVYMTRQKKLPLFRVVWMQLHGTINLRSLERCRAGWLQDSAVVLHVWCWKTENVRLDSSSIGHSISAMKARMKRLKEAMTFFHNCV